MPPSSTSAHARFLAAADRVFLHCGYDGSTIRAIAAEAGTSLANLSRHWSGKEDLFREVFARHFDRIHAAQNERLDAVEQAAAGGRPAVRAVLQAFYDPALQAGVGPREQRLSHMVYCRALVDPAQPVRRIVAILIRQVSQRVIGLLRRALPEFDAETFYLIVATAMGAYIQPQLFGMQLARAVGIRFGDVDWSRASALMANLVDSGIRQVTVGSTVGPGRRRAADPGTSVKEKYSQAQSLE
ncbi:MAG: TetR/AcrR family transcriptional regulator [Proteobacteria bacterium]|nr:TetR/AcrR family transcriptional regulator [Pseudomonadota bacterium]